MAEIAAGGDAFAEIEQAEDLRTLVFDAPSKPDRLPPMLFLAALVHGILIVGITFNSALGGPSEAISLEVTIVANPERSAAANDDADYLAQASQEGEGNTLLEVHPGALPESPVPLDNAGAANGNALKDAQTEAATADQVLTSRSPRDRQVADRPREEMTREEAIARALEAGVDSSLPLPRDERPQLMIHADNPRQLVTSVDTRESIVAAYLDSWKRKIEAMGVKYFPEQALASGHAGSPTLEVTIDASGDLHDVVIRRSSGSRVLDQAALEILRRASPFDPFPETIHAEYDQLRFAYKWEFSRISIPSAAGPPNSAE